MTIEFEEPTLGWRTLEDIYRHYRVFAVQLIERTHAAKVQTVLASLSPERARYVVDVLTEERAPRMGAIAAHLMTTDAAAGVWFAIGRKDGSGKHQLIDPHIWNFLLLDIKKDIVERDSLRFEDLRCAFTKDVPENHPIHSAIRIAQKHNSPVGSDAAFAAKQIFSPLTVPSATLDARWHDGPGRPSSFQLIESEFERRKMDNALEPSLNKQAEVLSAWFKSAHPRLQPYQPKTIVNRLRVQYRRATESLEKNPKL
jgi:hypothetical protein